VHRSVADEVIPALYDEPGFARRAESREPGDGEAIMIVLWQSAEQAQRPLRGQRHELSCTAFAYRRHLSRRSAANVCLGGHHLPLIA
jgi:hypothetical protein